MLCTRSTINKLKYNVYLVNVGPKASLGLVCSSCLKQIVFFTIYATGSVKNLTTGGIS